MMMISACKSTKKTANGKVFPHSFTLFKSFRNCKAIIDVAILFPFFGISIYQKKP